MIDGLLRIVIIIIIVIISIFYLQYFIVKYINITSIFIGIMELLGPSVDQLKEKRDIIGL